MAHAVPAGLSAPIAAAAAAMPTAAVRILFLNMLASPSFGKPVLAAHVPVVDDPRLPTLGRKDHYLRPPRSSRRGGQILGLCPGVDASRESLPMSLPHPLLSPHGASPADVKQQVEADRRGLPYLLFRDERGAQTIVALPNDRHSLALGRAAACDICLSWDRRVSGVHARLERLGGDWTVEDDGLSRNGTFVNGERVAGRRRL